MDETGKRVAREHRHHTDEAVLHEERKAGKRDHRFPLGPFLVVHPGVPDHCIGEVWPLLRRDEPDFVLTYGHAAVRAVDVCVQPSARLQLEHPLGVVQRPDACERRVQVPNQRLAAPLQGVPQRRSLGQRDPDVGSELSRAPAVRQRLLRPLALHELPNLAAKGGGHLQQIGVGLAQLAAEELDHSGDTGPAPDRERESAAHARGRRLMDSGELQALEHGDVPVPDRPVCRPHAARESDACRERALPRHPPELAEVHVGGMPHLEAPQHLALPIEIPEDTSLPLEAFGDRPQDGRAGLGQRRGLRQDACDRVLRRPSLLDLLALADVAHEGAEQPRALKAHRRDRELDGDLSPVAAQAGDLDALVQDRPFAARQEVRQSALMRIAMARRNDRRGQLPPHHIRRRPSEHTLCL